MDKLIGRLSGRGQLTGSIKSYHGYLTGRLSNQVSYGTYDGDYVVTPLAHAETVLQTQNKLLTDNVTVLEIPYYQTQNPSGGDTIYIGGN